MEANAEDIVDQVHALRWPKVAAGVTAMRAGWDQYRAAATVIDAGRAAELDTAIGELRRAVAAKDALGTEQAANDVSAPVVELFSRYQLAHPVQIGRLDVIGRQIIIDVTRDDFPAAVDALDHARREWHAVRAEVLRHRGRTVAARTDAKIEQLTRAIGAGDGRASKNEASDLLELVDSMERLF